MATVQLTGPITIAGTTYPAAQVIVVSPQRSQIKTILPKQEAQETNNQANVECPKRRIHFSKKALTHPRPQSVTKRNTRERNRVRAVNQGFVTLANHVPQHLRSKKMSKVDTLKAAIEYIQELQKVLGDESSSEIDSSLSEADSFCSSLGNTPTPQLSESLFFEEGVQGRSEGYSDGLSSPCSSVSSTVSYAPETTPFYSPNPQMYSMAQQNSSDAYQTQAPMWDFAEQHSANSFQQQLYPQQQWSPSGHGFSSTDVFSSPNEEEGILDMVSWLM